MISAAQTAPSWHDRAASADGPARAPERAEPDDGRFHPFGEDGFSFFDLIDAVNPLQHIPVIGPIYREITGDAIAPLPRIAGGTLFFGPAGAGLAAADVVIEQTTGRDAGAHALAMLHDDDPQTAEAADRKQPPSARAAAPSSAAAPPPPIGAPSPAASAPAATPAATAPDALRRDDPVLAWARAETAYRAAIAARSAPPRQPSGLLAAAPPGAAAPDGGWFSEAAPGAAGHGDDGDASQPPRPALNRAP